MIRVIQGAVLSAVLLSGCGDEALSVDDSAAEPRSQAESPKIYSSQSFAYKYPASWRLDANPPESDVYLHTLSAPGDNLVFIMVLPEEAADSLVDFAKNQAKSSKQAMGQKWSLSRMTSSVFETPGTCGPYASLLERFQVVTAGVAVSMQKQYLRRRVGKRVVFLWAQSSRNDAATIEKGFALVRNSFKMLP